MDTKDQASATKPRARKPRSAAEKPRAAPVRPHVKDIRGSRWYDDEGREYELDEVQGGVFSLRRLWG